MTRDVAHSVKGSRWALSVPVGVVASIGAGLILSAILGGGQPPAGWLTNVGAVLIVLVGTLVTGVVAGARTPREWVQAAMLTVAGLVAIGVVAFVWAVVTEPLR